MPTRFPRTVGQARALERLGLSLENDSFPQSLLLYGPPGVGQNALLADLAHILLCRDPSRRPCGACVACRELEAQRCEDLHFLFPATTEEQKENYPIRASSERWVELSTSPYRFRRGSKDHIAIESVRALKETLAYARRPGRDRVVLIFWAESMQEPAANCLLKVLEEPPPATRFLLHSEARNLLLPTILSRCVQLPLEPLAPDELEACLPAGGGPGRARLAALAGGSASRVFECEEQGGDELAGQAERLLAAAVRGDLEEFHTLVATGEPFQKMDRCLLVLRLATEMVRLALFAPGGGEGGLRPELAAEIRSLPDPEALARALESMSSAVGRYSKPSMALLGNFLKLHLCPPGATRLA